MKISVKPDATSAHHANRIDSPYAARELVDSALQNAGCVDPESHWPNVLEALLAEMSEWAVAVALRIAGLAEQPAQADDQPRQPADQPLHLRSDNTSGARGVDWHRGRWRARVWRGGKMIFSRSCSDKQRAIDARAQFLRENPCS